MAEHRDGTPPTLEELRKYADYLECQLFEMNRDMAEHSDPKNSSDIRMINLQLERMAEDIRAIKDLQKDLNFAIGQIGILAQKQDDTANAMARAHKRIDLLIHDFKEHKDRFDDKLRTLEVHQAKGAWMERAGMGILMAAAIAWSKGVL